MWDLWWTKWRWGKFSKSTLVSLANSLKFSVITITRGRYNRPVTGRRAEWTQYGLHHHPPPPAKKKPSLLCPSGCLAEFSELPRRINSHKIRLSSQIVIDIMQTTFKTVRSVCLCKHVIVRRAIVSLIWKEVCRAKNVILGPERKEY
jgi:hypothetical protein